MDKQKKAKLKRYMSYVWGTTGFRCFYRMYVLALTELEQKEFNTLWHLAETEGILESLKRQVKAEYFEEYTYNPYKEFDYWSYVGLEEDGTLHAQLDHVLYKIPFSKLTKVILAEEKKGLKKQKKSKFLIRSMLKDMKRQLHAFANK